MPIHKSFDKTFFKSWSYDMAYILGFLFADGNLVKTKRNTHFLAIDTTDRPLLAAMRKRLKSDHKISKKRSATGSAYRIQIGSQDLFDTLSDHGLHPGKVRRMKVPVIPIKFARSFIRGYFDGDGNVWYGQIHKKRKTQSLALQACFTSSSLDFLRSLHELLRSEGIRGGGLYVVKKGTYARLILSTLDALKLYEIMYNAPCSLFLDRKKRIFERFAKSRKLRV